MGDTKKEPSIKYMFYINSHAEVGLIQQKIHQTIVEARNTSYEITYYFSPRVFLALGQIKAFCFS